MVLWGDEEYGAQMDEVRALRKVWRLKASVGAFAAVKEARKIDQLFHCWMMVDGLGIGGNTWQNTCQITYQTQNRCYTI